VDDEAARRFAGMDVQFDRAIAQMGTGMARTLPMTIRLVVVG
jgi:hypothetical protein